MAKCKGILLDQRDKRIRPAKNNKVLAGWNGLIIAALAFASQTLKRPDWLTIAQPPINSFKQTLPQMSGSCTAGALAKHAIQQPWTIMRIWHAQQ